MKNRILVFLPLFFSLTFFSCSNSSDGENETAATFESADSYSVDDIKKRLSAENDETSNALLTYFNNEFKTESVDIVKDILKDNKEYFKKSDGSAVTDDDIDQAANAQNADVGYMVHVEEVIMKYPTTDPKGNKITASASILINYVKPTDISNFATFIVNIFDAPSRIYSKTEQVILHNHVTITYNKQCPSLDPDIATENGLMYKIALSSNMVVSPDYQGYGATSSMVHPYLIQEATAKQCYDAVVEAIKWKRNTKNWKPKGTNRTYDLRGLESDFDMYNFGYSQGGSVTLAVHNYIEKHDTKNSLHFRGSLCGDGPYQPVETYKWMLENGMYMPCVVPLILRSYLYYYGDSYLKGYKVSDFLNETVCNALKKGSTNEWELIDCKEYNTDEINDILFAALGKKGAEKVTAQEMFNPAALDINSAPAKALSNALAENDYTDRGKWPNAKNVKTIIAYHNRNDEVVPPVNTEKLIDNIGGTGKVKYNWKGGGFNAPLKGIHVDYGKKFFLEEIVIGRTYKLVKD